MSGRTAGSVRRPETAGRATASGIRPHTHTTNAPTPMTRSLLLTLALATAPAVDALDPHAAIDCGSCSGWNTAQAPFRVHGNTWYVGPRGLAVVMIETDDGLLLFDGALPQSVPQIEANLRALGHRLADVRWILVSHAHFDHVGGVAALQQASGARVAAAPGAATALRSGTVPADDPQAAYGDAMRFAPVADVVAIEDGAALEFGGLQITAHHTPGHTPGGSSWSWSSCDNGDCVTAVYADSLTTVSADGFRFSDDPQRVAAFERSIATIAALDCPLLLATHPGFTDLFERQAVAEASGERGAFIDPQACRRYAERAAEQLRKRLQAERAVPTAAAD